MNHNTLVWFAWVFVAFVLYQYKSIRPYVVTLILLSLLGLLLRYYPTIRQQFANIGK